MSARSVLLTLLAASVLAQLAGSHEPDPQPSAALLGPVSHAFIENRGQWDNCSLFQKRRGNSVVAIQRDGLTIQMLRIEGQDGARSSRHGRPHGGTTVRGWNVRLRFLDANPEASVEGVDERPGVHNWLLGNDRSAWVTGVRGYAAVSIRDVYPGIDFKVYERDQQLEYDFVLYPGADPARIALAVEGAEVLDASGGGLTLHTPWQDVEQSAALCSVSPSASGSGPVPRALLREGSPNVLGVELTSWDGQSKLTIDPLLVYATYLGGGNGDYPFGIAATNGRAIVGGSTLSRDFPLSPGAFQMVNTDSGDAFITSLTPDGSALVYSTLIGGVAGDDVGDVSIDSDGLAVAVGDTSSPDFPVTAAAYDTIHGGLGQIDLCLFKLNSDGSDLVFSTFLGGSDNDAGLQLAAKLDGSWYVAGFTESLDFPTTPNAAASTFGGSLTAIVAHLSSDASQLIASTMLGGTADSFARGLGVDADGNAYVSGKAYGNALIHIPVTAGAYDTTGNGSADAFAAKFNADLSALAYCTYLGGSDFDEAWGLALAPDRSVCIAGETWSLNFPKTTGVFQQFNKGPPDGFVTRLDPTGSSLVYSTYMGGWASDEIDEIALGADGSIFVAGDTTSAANSFPVTPDGWDVTKGGDGDSFLVRLDPPASAVTYGSYVGGNGTFIDECRTMTLDENGDAYIAGDMYSADFDTTPGALDSTLTDFVDAYVARFAFSPWIVMGSALAGGSGAPSLAGTGTLQPGSAGQLDLTQAAPVASAMLITGLVAIDAPFKGGTLVPAPLLLVTLATDASGEAHLPWAAWPAGVPAGTDVWLQAWQQDPGGPMGWAASNALRAVTP